MSKHNYKGIAIGKRSDGKFAYTIDTNSIRRIVEIGTLTYLKTKIDFEMANGATADCGRLVRVKAGA